MMYLYACNLDHGRVLGPAVAIPPRLQEALDLPLRVDRPTYPRRWACTATELRDRLRAIRPTLSGHDLPRLDLLEQLVKRAQAEQSQYPDELVLISTKREYKRESIAGEPA